MNDMIIRIENIGKKYLLRHEGDRTPLTFRESVMKTAKKLIQPVKQQTKEEFWALKDINCEIKRGDRLGIIGRNGAGKSTLFKVLSRITEPTIGRIEINGRVASLLEVGTGFHPELTGRENIFLNGAIYGMTKEEIKRKFDEIVTFSEVERFIDTPVKRYSSGMYVRLAFAVAAHLEPEILIVDEVLAVGDAAFQKKCIGKMEDVSKSGSTVLFISHNMGIVGKLCNKGMVLRSGTTSGIVDVDRAIRDYMSERESISNITYRDKVLKSVGIEQVERKLIISAKYDVRKHLHVLCIPQLGFVIKDSIGQIIFGTNPNKSMYFSNKKGTYPLVGDIKVVINNPKLVDGTYKLSIWFGDGTKDIFVDEDCLTFDVMNMGETRQYPNEDGYVIPDVEWSFS